MEDKEHIVALYDLLLRHFSLDELSTLSFRVDVDYDSIAGDQKATKARELILFMKRRNLLAQLTREIQIMRPDIQLPTASDDGKAAIFANPSGRMAPTDAAGVAQRIVDGVAPLLSAHGDTHPSDDQSELTWELYELVLFVARAAEDDLLAQTLAHYEEEPDTRQAVFREILQEALETSPVFLRAFSALLSEIEPGTQEKKTMFKTDISGGEVGQVINVDRLEGGLTIGNTR